jgi:hypothetical protein
MLKGFMYFMLILMVLWVAQGFGTFLTDMWPLIKWGILVGAFIIIIKQLGGKKDTTTTAAPEEPVTADPEGPAE